MRFTEITGQEAKDVAAEIRKLNMSTKKHFFNVFMWIILMTVPVIILLLTDALARFIETMYWPYRHWVERIFPTR